MTENTKSIKRKQEAFNPVKEDVSGVQAKRAIWSTRSLDLALEGLKQGRKLVANPFYENNTKLIKGDLVFDRTPEEVKEWLRCKNDISYFVEKYCKLMTPEGIKNVKLRDYQKNYLKHLEQHRLSIYLACRQCGKCISLTTKVTVKIHEVIHSLPLYELYNMYDNSIEWKRQYELYKLYETHQITKDKLYKLLEENHLYIRDTQKIVKSFLLDNIEILSDTGWTSAAYIHFIQPYKVYTLTLENGITLDVADEHIVFCENHIEKYVKDLSENDYVITQNGLFKVKQIESREVYINMCDITVLNIDESYYTNGILSHNTTTSAVFMLHYILFNIDKNALVLGNKRKTAVEILDKAKKIYLELPFFLKPGIYKWNEGEIVLDNGCRLMAEATTINSGISFTFHCVLADEFAHVQPNIIDKFYNNLFPTITAAKARFMITSTQNGYNLFYRLYKAAEAGISEYKAFKTDWHEVPEYSPETKTWIPRDEAWHQMQVANYGSEEAFNKQFGTNFDVSANTLISMKIIQKKQQKVYEFVEKDMPGVMHSNAWKWHPLFDPMESRNHYLVLTTDIAEGRGGDYTVCNVHRFIEPGSNKLECVGYFRSNTLTREQAALSIQQYCCTLCNQDKILLSLERNTYGDLFIKLLQENYDKNVPGCQNYDNSILVKYYNDNFTKFDYGIKVTSGNKTKHCLLYKEDYENDVLINDSAEYLIELNNFTDKGNGTYAAAFGHDDMVMTEVQLTFVKQTLQYKLLKDEFESSSSVDIATTDYNPFEAFDGFSAISQLRNLGYSMYDNLDINSSENRLRIM